MGTTKSLLQPRNNRAKTVHKRSIRHLTFGQGRPNRKRWPSARDATGVVPQQAQRTL